MRILMLGSRVLRSLDHEVNHIVNRCVLGIPGLLTDVIVGLSIRHFESLRGVVRIFRCKDCVGQRRRKQPVRADLEGDRRPARGAVHRCPEEPSPVEDSGATGQ
jgi:hypothetical protein